MRNFSEFAQENEGKIFWDCDAGIIDGESCVDVLAYDTEAEMEADNDNTLAVARETLIDDRITCAGCGEYIFGYKCDWSNGSPFCDGCAGPGEKDE